jgi:hypothetical protein
MVISKQQSYLSEWILDECFVCDQIEEADPAAIEGEDVLRGAGIFQIGIDASDLNRRGYNYN